MMRKTIGLLATLLGAQLVMAAALGWLDRGLSTPVQATPLVEVAAERIDRVTIEGPDAAKVVLAKSDGQWRIADAGDFPADAKRIEQLLERLGGLRTGTPVATSASARARFKVDAGDFERRISLAAGNETLATLYLGTSPGLRRIHARTDGEEAIYSVAFAAYDVPAKASDWEDKALLAFPKSEVRSLEVAGLQVRKQDADSPGKPAGEADAKGTSKEVGGPAWVADGLDAGERLAADAVDRLVGLIADLRFVDVRGREAKPEYGLEDPALTFTVSRASGDPVTYRLGKAAESEDYTLQVSSRLELFHLGASTAKSLLDAARRDALLQKTAEGPKDG